MTAVQARRRGSMVFKDCRLSIVDVFVAWRNALPIKLSPRFYIHQLSRLSLHIATTTLLCHQISQVDGTTSMCIRL